MAVPARRAAEIGIPRASRPAVIAHGAGNSQSRLSASLEEGADFIEVDLFLRRGQFEARHERRAGWLPVLFEKWYLRLPARGPFTLGQLFEDTRGRAELFLDLKNGHDETARLVHQAVRVAGAGRGLAASSQDWDILRRVAEIAPGVALFYSVGVQAQLDLFFSVADRDGLPAGISCRESLVTRDVIDAVHGRGQAVVAWTVDDVERAAELCSWGVDGITTHRVAEVRAAMTARV